MTIEKIVKCKTDHKCGWCNKKINKGESAFFMSGKEPRYESGKSVANKEQIGINYFKVWFCYDKNTEQWPSCAINS